MRTRLTDLLGIEHPIIQAKLGRIGDVFPASGQSAGLIRDIVPEAKVVRRLVEEARTALVQAGKLVSTMHPRSTVTSNLRVPANFRTTVWGNVI